MRKLTALLLVVSSLAFAQTEQQKSVKPKTQNIIFGEGTDITGEPEFPELTIYEVPTKKVFKSLIKERTNFNDKLMESVHQL